MPGKPQSEPAIAVEVAAYPGCQIGALSEQEPAADAADAAWEGLVAGRAQEVLTVVVPYLSGQGPGAAVEQRREHFERIARLPEEERAGYEQTLAELEHNISVAERRARLLRAALESLRSAAERSGEAARRELEAARQAAGSGGASPADLAAAERRLINAESTVQLLNAILEP